MKRFFLSVLMAVVAGCGFAQDNNEAVGSFAVVGNFDVVGTSTVEPEEIKMLLESTESTEWYQSMYEAWHRVALENPKDDNAWLNCYNAAYYARMSDDNGNDSIKNSVADEVKANIPDTYVYYYIMYRNSSETEESNNYAEEALKRLPAKLTFRDYDTWLCYLVTQGDTSRATEWAKAYLASGLYPEVVLLFAENLLNGMDKNAIYLSTTDMYLIPVWLLQYGKGEHLDKIALNAGNPFDKTTWTRICKQFDVEVGDDYYPVAYDYYESTLLKDIVEKTGRPLYCAPDNTLGLTPNGVREGIIQRCDSSSVDYLKKHVNILDKVYDYSFIRSGVDHTKRWQCEGNINYAFLTAVTYYVQPMRIQYPQEFSRLMPKIRQACENIDIPKDSIDSTLEFMTFNLADTAACYSWGMSYYDDGDYDNAVPLFEIAANKGHVDALVALGDYYYYDCKDSDSNAKAENYYQKAVKKKNSDAMRGLGEMYLEDKATEKKGLEWLKKAGDLGNVNAMIALTNYHNEDTNTYANEKEGFAWALKAADQGDMRALEYVGECYAEGEGAEKNVTEAKRYLEKAARNGSVNSMLALGELNASTDDGNTPDYREALHWYEKAAEQGDVEGYNNMAYIFANGLGVKKNMQKAYNIIDKGLEAASEGDADASGIAHLYDTKGELYTMDGDDANALECWKKVREADSGFYNGYTTTLNDYIGEHHPTIEYQNEGWSIVVPYDFNVTEYGDANFECYKDNTALKIFYGKKTEDMNTINSSDDILSEMRKAMENNDDDEAGNDESSLKTNIGPNYSVDFLGMKCKALNGVMLEDDALRTVRVICHYDKTTQNTLVVVCGHTDNEESKVLEDILNTMKLQ